MCTVHASACVEVCAISENLKACGSNHPSNASLASGVVNGIVYALELGSQKGRNLEKTTLYNFTVFVGEDLKILIHRCLCCIAVPSYCCFPLTGYGL